MAPKCWFFALTAKHWGSRCCLREIQREDPQDEERQHLLGPYLKIPQSGLASHEQQGFWLTTTKFVTKFKFVLLAAWQANKSKDKFLEQGVAALFRRPALWENGGLMFQRTIFPELEVKPLFYWKGRGCIWLLQTSWCLNPCSCSCPSRSVHSVPMNLQ